jgi:hypothetical protein
MARLILGLLAAIVGLAHSTLPATAQAHIQGDEAAFIRFVHASPTAPALDFYVDDALVVQGLAFGAATDIFISVSPGTSVVGALATDGAGANVVAEASVDLAADAAYELVVVGSGDDTLIQVYPIDWTATSDGQARVRLIVCAPDALAASLSGLGSLGSLEEAEYLSASAYVEVEAGSYDVTLHVIGAEQTAEVRIGSVTFEAGGIYDLLVIGFVADESTSLLVVRA